MKKAIYSVACTLLLMLGTSKMNAQEGSAENIDPNAPEITFESDVVDYGTIEHNSNGVREFKFKNTGKSPLIIQNVQGTCGCTTTIENGKKGWPEEPIAPGKTGVIRVKYDTNRVGSFDKQITVTTNGKVPLKYIHIKGIVKPAVTAPVPSNTTQGK